jgi:hypothetical protein
MKLNSNLEKTFSLFNYWINNIRNQYIILLFIENKWRGLIEKISINYLRKLGFKNIMLIIARLKSIK